MGEKFFVVLFVVFVLYGIAARSVHPKGVTKREEMMLEYRESLYNFVSARLYMIHTKRELLGTTSKCETVLCFLQEDPSYLGKRFVFDFTSQVLDSASKILLLWFDIFLFSPIRMVYRAWLDIVVTFQ